MTLDEFISDWQDVGKIKEGFLLLKENLENLNGVQTEFVPREGVTYSLRAKHENQTEKPLFTMVDVIEGEPRWLSVCFYAAFITDPGEKGDFVPGGLLGEDAICFDVEEYDESVLSYIVTRLKEAAEKASEAS